MHHLADMHIATSDASVKLWSFKFVHPFSKKNRYIDVVTFSLNSGHQSLKNFECSADNSLSHACHIAARMSLTTKKRVVCTHKFPSFALGLLASGIRDIGCRHLGQQFEETSLLCRLIKLFGVLGSRKQFWLDSAASLVQIRVFR